MPKKASTAPAGTKITAVLPPTLFADVDELAKRENRSRSNAIVELLKRALAAHNAAHKPAASPAA